MQNSLLRKEETSRLFEKSRGRFPSGFPDFELCRLTGLCCSSPRCGGVSSGSTLQQHGGVAPVFLSSPSQHPRQASLFLRSHREVALCLTACDLPIHYFWPTTVPWMSVLGLLGLVTSLSDPWCGERQWECPRAPGSRDECAGAPPDHSYRK